MIWAIFIFILAFLVYTGWKLDDCFGDEQKELDKWKKKHL